MDDTWKCRKSAGKCGQKMKRQAETSKWRLLFLRYGAPLFASRKSLGVRPSARQLWGLG